MAGSCRLDPVLTPPNAGPNNGQTVLGITVNGPVINNAYLTGMWSVELTIEQYYDVNNAVITGVVAPNKFTSVTLNDQAKTSGYGGLSAGVAPSTGTYKLGLNENVFYVDLSADPFSRSSNTLVRITSLTSTAMTWVAIDAAIVMYNGQPAHKAYQVIFAR